MPIWRGPLDAASLGHISGPAVPQHCSTRLQFYTSFKAAPPGRAGAGGREEGDGRRGGGGVRCLHYSGSGRLMVGLNTPTGWPKTTPNSNFSKWKNGISATRGSTEVLMPGNVCCPVLTENEIWLAPHFTATDWLTLGRSALEPHFPCNENSAMTPSRCGLWSWSWYLDCLWGRCWCYCWYWCV